MSIPLMTKRFSLSLRRVGFVFLLSLSCSAIGAAEADPELLQSVLDEKTDVQLRDAAVKMLSKTKDGALAMIAMADKGTFPDELKSSAALALAESEDEDVVKKGAKSLPLPVMKDGTQIPPVSKLLDMTGDPKAGRDVFRSASGPNCINCHKIDDEGKEIGPPLSTIGEKGKEANFESILAPSASIQHGFEAWTVKTTSGKIVSGILKEDSDEKIVLLTTEGVFEEIPAAEVKKKTQQKASLMPENLIKTMTTKDLVDLVEYLATLKVK